MATNQTEFLGLSQWVPSDRPQMVEFNRDNEKIDDMLETLSQQIEDCRGGTGVDSYTRAEIDDRLAEKANAAEVYTRAEVDQKIPGAVDLGDYYTKVEMDERFGEQASAPSVATFTLTAAGWIGSAAPYTQTVAITGITAHSNGICDVAPSASAAQVTAFSAANVWQYAQANGSITFRAAAKPSTNIPVKLLIVG